MHWFWRAAIAAGIAYVAQRAISVGLVVVMSPPGLQPLDYLRSMLFSSLLWIPVGLPLAALPIPIYLALTRRFGPPNIPAGHCQHCGYDLTGNTSGVCPECGEQI